MSDSVHSSGRSATPPVIAVEQEEFWREVEDFKARQFLGPSRESGGNGSSSPAKKSNISWELVECCSQKSQCGSLARSLPGSEFGVASEATQEGSYTGALQGFESAHAKALAELEAEEKLLPSQGVSPPLPVSTEIHDSDVQVVSEPDLSEFSQGGTGELVSSDAGLSMSKASLAESEIMEARQALGEEGYSSCEEVEGLDKKVVLSEPDSPEAMLDLQNVSQEGSVDGNFWPDVVSGKAPSESGAAPSTDQSVEKKSSGVDADSVSTRFLAWLEQWAEFLRDMLPEGSFKQYIGKLSAAASQMDWKSVVHGAGLAMLSALILGLFVHNRKLSSEVRKKQEEVTRLMMTLMNFQELWSSNRSRGPILRHTSISQFAPHRPF